MKPFSMNDYFSKVFLPPRITHEFTADRYLDDLEKGAFKDQFVLGVLEKDGGEWLCQDFVTTPNALFVGGMGSGKSVSCKFSVLSFLCANPEKTFMFIVDTAKNAGDYKALFAKDDSGKRLYEQVYEVFTSDGALRVLDLLYDEYVERQKMFREFNSENITDYEKKSKTKVNRVVTVFEEVYTIFQALDFAQNFKKENTAANKFWKLMKMGRASGIWFMACTQRAFSSDIPSEIISNWVNKLVFAVSVTESTYFLGRKDAAEIRGDQKGRCLSPYGFIQFPFISPDQDTIMLERYVKGKKLKGRFAYMSLKMVDNYLQGRTTEELYGNKKLYDLVDSIESQEAELIISIIHKRMKHKVESVDSKSHQQGISHIIHWNKDIKIAVITRARNQQKKVTKNHIMNLRKAMSIFECVRGIIYTSSTDLPYSLYEFAKKMDIEIVDHEDLRRIAYRLEAEGDKAEFTPDSLADESKETGAYQKENNVKENDDDELDESSYSTFDQLDEDPDTLKKDDSVFDNIEEVKDQSPPKKDMSFDKLFNVPDSDDEQQVEPKEEHAPEDLNFGEAPVLDEEEEKQIEVPKTPIVQPPTVVVKKEDKIRATVADAKKEIEEMLIPSKVTFGKTLKRIPVKKVFTLKKESLAALLTHVLRNESGEIYRVLFYVIENGEKRSEFFVDRKVQAQFSHKEKIMLGITSVDDWNSQKEVLDQGEFDREINEYLLNFEICQVQSPSICWRQDVDFLKKYLKNSRNMRPNPIVIEDFCKEIFGIDFSRLDLMGQYGIEVTRPDVFTPISIDFKIWKEMN